MRIILTLLCRNEADVIAATVDFHLRCGVDFIIATDNGSTDGTVAILEGYERQGVLRLLHEPDHTHDQAVWVSRMARLAAEEHGADWVIPCDADEFWWPRAPDLKAELRQVPDQVMALQVERFNFLPPAGDGRNGDEPFYQRQVLRECRSLNSLGDPLPPKVCHRGLPELSLSDGNHAVFVGGQPLCSQPHAGLEILHFPVRSYPQLERKIRDGAEALARNTRVSPQVGLTWRRLYADHLCAGTLPQYYTSLRPGPEELSAALLRGDLVEDRRLQRVLASPQSPC